MSATRTAATKAQNTTPDAASSALERRIDGARRDVAAGLESIRTTAGDVGERVPGLVDGVRSGAAAGARELEILPESTRNLIAAVSIGLGAGLAIAGAPRLLLGAAFIPAITVAATGMRRTVRPA
jgi:hypothetical protein